MSDSLLFYILDGSILRGIKKNLRKKLRILRNAFKILILTAEDTKWIFFELFHFICSPYPKGHVSYLLSIDFLFVYHFTFWLSSMKFLCQLKPNFAGMFKRSSIQSPHFIMIMQKMIAVGQFLFLLGLNFKNLFWNYMSKWLSS